MGDPAEVASDKVASPQAAAAGSGQSAGAARWLVTVAAAVIAVDLFSKVLAVAILEGREPVRLLGGAVYLTLTRNSGAAFGLAAGYTVVLTVVAVAVVAVIVRTARRLTSVPWAVSLGLILGGAVGNLVDRIFRAPGPLRGAVIDFISVFDDSGGVWPVFNVADSALVVGVLLAVLLELTGRRWESAGRVRDSRDDESDS